MKDKKLAHISEYKKNIVRELGKLMDKKTIMIVSIKNIPSFQLQEIRKRLRDKAEIKIAKKNLINLALESIEKEHLKELEEYVEEDCALIFSDNDAFELSAFLSENKSSTKAKPGQIAPEDIKVEAGPTSLIPGPDISLLGSVGLQVKVEGGKIAIQESRILIKKGEKISEQIASVLAKLDITPFKIGLEPLVAFYEDKVYTDIRINKEEILNELIEQFSRSLVFAVSVYYPVRETIGYILAKALSHENALSGLITQENKFKEQENAE